MIFYVTTHTEDIAFNLIRNIFFSHNLNLFILKKKLFRDYTSSRKKQLACTDGKIKVQWNKMKFSKNPNLSQKLF